jgi:choice-of-anchor C domain-containing protein
MGIRKILTPIAVALTIAGFGAGMASALGPVITNPGFEDPVVPPGGPGYIFDTTTLTGWTVSAGNIDILASSYWQPHSGNQSIDLYGCLAGTIYQAITTTAGQPYVLSYWVAGNADSAGIRTSTVKVGSTVGGSDLATQNESFDTTGKTKTAMGWELRSLNFTAVSTTSYIQFNDTSTSTCQGIALDDISVDIVPPTDVPEVPLNVLLPLSGAALGALSLWVVYRRRYA